MIEVLDSRLTAIGSNHLKVTLTDDHELDTRVWIGEFRSFGGEIRELFEVSLTIWASVLYIYMGKVHQDQFLDQSF